MSKSTPEKIIEEVDRSAIGEATATQIKDWIRRLAKSIDELDTACAPLKAIEAGHEIRIRQLEARSKPQIFLGHVEGSIDGDTLESPTVVRKLRDELRSANGRIGRLLARGGELEKQNAITQAQLEKFMSACADQTIQIMELRSENHTDADTWRRAHQRVDELEAKAKRLEATIAHTRATVSPEENKADERRARAELGERDARRRADELEKQLGRLRAITPRGSSLTTEQLITETIEACEAPCPDCKGMAEALEQARENCAVADGDRVPLAMDLAEAKAEIEHMRPVIAAIQRWNTAALPADVAEAREAYEKARSEAAADDIAF